VNRQNLSARGGSGYGEAAGSQALIEMRQTAPYPAVVTRGRLPCSAVATPKPLGQGWIVRALRRQFGRVVLGVIGILMIGFAYWQPNGGGAVVTTSLVIGSLMVILACVIQWVVKATAGPLSVEVRPEAEAELTTLMAETEPGTVNQQLGDSPDAAGIEPDDVEIAAARYLAANRALRPWLTPTDGPLARCEFRLFMYDVQRDRLLPALEIDPGDSDGWRIGHGVTGEAYESGDYVLAVGPDCSNDTHGLTPEQQDRYQDLTAVAAMPVTNAAGEIIAVLSASSKDPNPVLATVDGQREHVLMAVLVARVVINLLGWWDDSSGG
jgi:hypothetical protein